MKLIKQVVFVVFFVTVCAELIQNNYRWIEITPLHGGIKTSINPTYSLDNWLSGMYQDSVMKYYENSIDLHPVLTRVNNQIAYSCFKKIKVGDVEEGKNHILFGGGYNKSYLGLDSANEGAIEGKIIKLAYVQEELKKRNVDMVFLIAPGKSSFYPEFIPEKYEAVKRRKSYYDYYAEKLGRYKINFIDCRNYFLKLKGRAKHDLFTRCGIHWSMYGSTLAADTLFRYMEQLRNVDMQDYYYAGGKETCVPEKTDDDIGKAMNLMFDIPSFKMYYPNLVVKKDSLKTKPNVLLVGDSFVWSWIGTDSYIPALLSDKSAFWYYNREVAWPQTNGQDNYPVEKLNLKEETLHRDFIVLVFNEANLSCGEYNFIEQMYDMLKGEEVAVH